MDFISFRTHFIFQFGYIVCNGAQPCHAPVCLHTCTRNQHDMIGLMYGRDMLLSLNRGQGPSTLVKERLRRLGISVTGRRPRGCRAGRRCRVTNLRALGNGSFVVTSNRQRQNALPRNVVNRRVRHRRRRWATSPTAPRRQT